MLVQTFMTFTYGFSIKQLFVVGITVILVKLLTPANMITIIRISCEHSFIVCVILLQ